MSKKENPKYEPVENLKDELKKLYGRKFILDCGHKVTIGHSFGNDIVILNGRKLEIICSDCH